MRKDETDKDVCFENQMVRKDLKARAGEGIRNGERKRKSERVLMSRAEGEGVARKEALLIRCEM